MRLVWAAFIAFSFIPLAASASPETERCRALIPKIVCEVDPPTNEPDRYKDGRTCLKTDTSRYQATMRAAFDVFPDFLQRRFCQLNKIYIEKDYFGSAWSSAVDEGNPTRFLIGLRKKDIDAKLDVAHYRTWFGQQSFGGNPDFSVNPKLPLVHIIGKSVSSTAFTLLHELGHTFDYEAKYNVAKGDPAFDKSWTHLSWEDIAAISTSSDFDQRKSICLNRCQGHYLSAASAGGFYRDLFSHGFLSQLSAINAMEDFAESFAFYIAQKYMNIEFEVEASGKRSSVSAAMNDQRFREKLRYLSGRF